MFWFSFIYFVSCIDFQRQNEGILNDLKQLKTQYNDVLLQKNQLEKQLPAAKGWEYVKLMNEFDLKTSKLNELSNNINRVKDKLMSNLYGI